MNFKNRTLLASLATTLGVVMVAALGLVALRAQQGPPQGRGPGGPGGQGGRGFGMFGPGPGGRGGPMAGLMMHGLGQLDLTEEQKAKIKAIVEENRPATQEIAKKMIAAREALGDAITADPVDKALIGEKAKAVAAVELESALLRADVHGKVFGVLTPEQQAKARQLRAEAKERPGRGMGRGGRGPGGAGKGDRGTFGSWL